LGQLGAESPEFATASWRTKAPSVHLPWSFSAFQTPSVRLPSTFAIRAAVLVDRFENTSEARKQSSHLQNRTRVPGDKALERPLCSRFAPAADGANRGVLVEKKSSCTAYPPGGGENGRSRPHAVRTQCAR